METMLSEGRLEDIRPIELLRYGTRVAVLAAPATRSLEAETGLEVVGPRAFGYQMPFQPLAGEGIGIKGISIKGIGIRREVCG